jgi:FlaA1/EpsC-like NDP-sugar epimerase
MTIDNKTILVTGACSFVGKHFIHYLIKNSNYNKIIACCRNRKKFQKIFSENSKLINVNADLLKPHLYNIIFNTYKPNHIVHLAAVARFKDGEENPQKTIKTNFLGSVHLLNLAEKYNAERFLFVSSNLARNPKGITGYSKYLTEAYIKKHQSDVKIISIRLPNVIDSPGAVTLIFKKQIEQNLPITITDKRMSRKFITPEKAAEQLVFALTKGNYNNLFINNRPSTFIVDLAEQMISDSRKNIEIRFIGMRPGEKLQEEDYPEDSVLKTADEELFLLTENQHGNKTIKGIIESLNNKLPLSLISEINKVLEIH